MRDRAEGFEKSMFRNVKFFQHNNGKFEVNLHTEQGKRTEWFQDREKAQKFAEDFLKGKEEVKSE